MNKDKSQKGNLFILFLVPFMMLFVLGCATAKPNPFTEGRISQIKPGVSTEQQLVQLFGKPSSRSLDSEGRHVLSWNYSNYSIGFAHDTMEIKTLHGVFDDNNLLVKYLLTDDAKKFNVFGEVQ